MRKIIGILFVILSFSSFAQKGKIIAYEPGNVWKGTDGKFIQAHGGGVLYDKGKYYWYGENKNGPTLMVGPDKTKYRSDVVGVSCYSSSDLMNWKNEGVVLPAVKNDTSSDLHSGKVVERPKVIYNEKTKKYVMWMHVDNWNYKYARAGVAVADKPTGPFRYLGSVRPNGNDSRDMTIFKDEDGKAYHIYSSEGNSTTHICLLTDDYLKHTETYVKAFEKKFREASALFKHNGKYYIVTSGCTGWDANPAQYAAANSIWGPWEAKGNPCIGPDADNTFHGQSTFVLPIVGKPGKYIMMFDRWKKEDLGDSRYLWLPLSFNENDQMEIFWKDKWSFSVFDK